MNWCEPRDLRDWCIRSFSLRSLTFILIVLLLTVFEFRFDWMEKALGSYLSTTNRQRPETGDIWDKAHERQQALESLDEITDDREVLQRNARSAVDLSDIISYIADNQSVMISPDHFRSLYTKLPPSIASRIISSNVLLLPDIWVFRKVLIIITGQDQSLTQVTLMRPNISLMNYMKR